MKSSKLREILSYLKLSIQNMLQCFKTCLIEKGFHAYKECFVPLSNWCGISQSTLFGDPASLLAHRPVFSSHVICNSPSSPLVNIVLFEPISHFFFSFFVFGDILCIGFIILLSFKCSKNKNLIWKNLKNYLVLIKIFYDADEPNHNYYYI